MIIFIPFAPALDRTRFACGRPGLDTRLRDFAGQQERAGLARTTFAVDEHYQGQGIGKIVLFTALECLVKASQAIGFEIVVDALDETAACFYLRHGFRRFAEHSLKLFMTTKALRATFAEST